MSNPEEIKTKSIVDPSRRADMKGASDWVGHFMEAGALTKGVGAKPAVEAVEGVDEVKDEAGNVIVAAVAEVKGKAATKGKDVWDLDKMFLLAERNGIDTTHATFTGIRDTGNVGRARMTISNMLRSRGRKRHGLFDIDGNWADAPADFIGDAEKVETPEGVKIPKAKPAKEAEGETEAQTEGAEAEEAAAEE